MIPEWSEKSFLYTVPSPFPSRQLKKVFCKDAEFDFPAQWENQWDSVPERGFGDGRWDLVVV